MASATELFRQKHATKMTVETTPRKESDDEVIASHISESSFIVEGQLFDAQIRSQRLQQKREELRGNIYKTERKKMWADTEEIKKDIQEDDLSATRKRKILNREGHVQSLSSKSYTIEGTKKRNDGVRQKLINEGVTLKLDHTKDFQFNSMTSTEG